VLTIIEKKYLTSTMKQIKYTITKLTNLSIWWCDPVMTLRVRFDECKLGLHLDNFVIKLTSRIYCLGHFRQFNFIFNHTFSVMFKSGLFVNQSMVLMSFSSMMLEVYELEYWCRLENNYYYLQTATGTGPFYPKAISRSFELRFLMHIRKRIKTKVKKILRLPLH